MNSNTEVGRFGVHPGKRAAGSCERSSPVGKEDLSLSTDKWWKITYEGRSFQVQGSLGCFVS